MNNKNFFSLLSNYYALYIKVQSYHWNIIGLNFISLHKLFGEQYQELAKDIDDLAERIRFFGDKIPVSLSKFNSLKIISDANENFIDTEMIKDFYESNNKIIELITALLTEYKDDVITTDLLTEKLASRDKISWILSSMLG